MQKTFHKTPADMKIKLAPIQGTPTLQGIAEYLHTYKLRSCTVGCIVIEEISVWMQAGLAMDPNRAFQAINAETLEQASQNVDYPVPPQSVSPHALSVALPFENVPC